VDSTVVKQIHCNDLKGYKIVNGEVIRRDSKCQLIDTNGLYIYVGRALVGKGYFTTLGYFSLGPCSGVYRLNYHQLKKRVFTKKFPDSLGYNENRYYKASKHYNETFINEVYNDYLKNK
jgi:hypothetical protein